MGVQGSCRDKLSPEMSRNPKRPVPPQSLKRLYDSQSLGKEDLNPAPLEGVPAGGLGFPVEGLGFLRLPAEGLGLQSGEASGLRV